MCYWQINDGDDEAKAKTEARKCNTEIETSLVNSVACESKTNRYASLSITCLK